MFTDNELEESCTKGGSKADEIYRSTEDCHETSALSFCSTRLINYSNDENERQNAHLGIFSWNGYIV